MASKANKAIKYRLYPTEEQSVLFAKTFGCCRKVYNLMLDDKIKNYKDTKSFGIQTPAKYKSEYTYLKEVDSLALANVQLNLQQGMKNCFASKHCKFPKFKTRKNSRRSYTTNNQKGTIALFDDAIKLPKIGQVEAVIHRQPGSDWETKSATISQDADGKYYVSVLFEYEKSIVSVSKNTTRIIGLDYKSDGLYMDSDGVIGSNHKYLKEGLHKLAKAQKKLSRKQGSKKGEEQSNNFIKQKKKVAKIHKHISNQRLDNLHKTSTKIANSVDVVCVENLNMKALSNKGFRNGKATLDNGYGMFLKMLEYKLHDRGKYFIKVDKWYPSSQLCSCCGARQKLQLKDRTYKCACGNVMDRDINAAINIKKEGIRLLKEAA